MNSEREVEQLQINELKIMVQTLEDRLQDCERSTATPRASWVGSAHKSLEESHETVHFYEKQRVAQKRLAVLNLGYFLRKKVDANRALLWHYHALGQQPGQTDA